MSHMEILVHPGPDFETQTSEQQIKQLKELYYNLFIIKNTRGGRVLQNRGGEWVDITEEHNNQRIQEAQMPYDALCCQLGVHCSHRAV